MNRDKLEQVIADIRNEQVDDEIVRTAARRVFRNVFDSAFFSDRVERIRGCADFKALIPAYLTHSLTPARRSLLEDHTSHCVDCRRALREAREADLDPGSSYVARRASPSRRQIHLIPWMVAASLTVGLAIGVTGAFKGLLPGQHAVRATVLSVEGTLYKVSDLGSSLVAAGTVIKNAEELRTAKGSRAILRLVNGARIEIGERSDMSVSGGWRGPGVNLERGQMIVRTADQGQKVFFVHAGDVLIPVRSAVLSVNRGTKGSRIALAQGSTEVQQPQRTVALHAGQQFSSDYRLGLVPIATEFAWSQNADYYLSLLKELTSLQKQLQAIPSPGLRYTSSLSQYLPDNTVAYAAIPNLGGTVAEAKRIFDERLAESDVLRQWWQQQSASRNGNLDQVLSQISSISEYLGDEIVFAILSTGQRQYGDPILVARTRQSGLEEYLRQNAPAEAGIQIVGSATAPPPDAKHSLFVSLANGFVVASPSLQEVQTVEQTIANPSLGHFTQTPFYNRISQSYANGVGYLLAVDMEQIVQKSVNMPKEVPPGFDNAQYLVLERRDASGKSETRAALSFAGTRQGIASWLAAPGPMGSLDFVSPDATFAAAVVMKNPKSVVNELITTASQANPQVSQHLSEMQNELGVNLADDLAAPFGGDATVAIDGPLLPIPAWKLIAEVYDPARLQQTVATVVDHFNQRAAENSGKLTSGSEQVNSRTFYWLRNSKYPNITVYYTFVDGYLVAGASEANLLQTIQNRQTGYKLVTSSRFQSQLPDDSYTNFSAIVYHNAGSTLGPIANQLKNAAPLTSAQQQSLSALLSETSPGLVCVYGEPNRIVAATNASFLGFNLGTLMGIAQGRPVVPLIASSAEGAISAASKSQQRRN